MSKAKPLPPVEYLQREFNYDPHTGLFTHAYTKSTKAKAGQVAGSVKHDGYIILTVKFNGKSKNLNAARVAYSIYYNEQLSVDVEIDHRDLNKANNKIDNLRKATHGQNQANRATWKKGLKGVYCEKGLRKKPWRVKIVKDGKRFYLGSYATEQEAYAVYAKAAEELHGHFANT